MQAPNTRDSLQPAALRFRTSRSSTPAASRKRKRDDQDIPAFTARHIDSTTKPSAVTFAPIVLIPRSNIPLVWLAPAASYKPLASPYLFEAEVLPAWQHQGCALIARLSPNGGLYAIERASPSSWVACRLASWVTEQHCHDATDRRGQLLPQDSGVRGQHRHTRSDSHSTTNSGRPLTPCSPKVPKNRRGAQVRMSLFSSRHRQDEVPNSQLPGSTNGCISQDIITSSEDASKHSHEQLLEGSHLKIPDKALSPSPTRETPREEMADIVLPTTEPDTVQQSQQGPLTADHVIHQYLETLYLSRTSLAFYAKGPLSRARALAKSLEGGLSTEQLIDCLSSGIMPPKKADVKYREGLPTAIRSLFSAAEGENSSSTKKKRASRKVKLGKDGLYNCEHTVMEKWWRGREIGVCVGTTSTADAPADALEADIRQALSELRTRETQMQVLLILEVMALGAKAHPRAETKQEIDEKVDQTLTSTPKAKRKPRNLQTELDALIDKLCIWHTVSTDYLQLSTVKSDGVSEGPAKSKDELKEFYQEIIKPFYGSRLPQQTKLLCEKLVGTETRPERTHVSPQSHGHQKVRSEIKSRLHQAAKRPLEHGFSDKEMTRSESPPLHSRSSTLPSLKRERSMSALRRVPSDLAKSAESRPRMQRSVSFLGRQIDLVADAKAHQAKREKMDKINMQRSELKAVIDAVKKPNRSTVSKEIMDEVEQHKRVQITATPSRRKAMQLLKSQAHLMGTAEDEEHDPEAKDIVPSSTMKPSVVARVVPSAPRRETALDAIAYTPSKATARSSISLAPPPPTGFSGNLVAATPGRVRLQPDLPSYLAATPVSKMNKSGRTVLFTPLKRSEVDIQDIFKDAPIIPEDAGKAMDRVMGGKGIEDTLGMDTGESIYDRLGWNYDE